MDAESYPRVSFGMELDERARFEIPLKGWARVRVESASGVSYEIIFMDVVRLEQELADGTAAGEPYIAEPGLVVMPCVTIELIEQIVPFLVRKRFFSALKPI